MNEGKLWTREAFPTLMLHVFNLFGIIKARSTLGGIY